jgi:hypothetical protein
MENELPYKLIFIWTTQNMLTYTICYPSIAHNCNTNRFMVKPTFRIDTCLLFTLDIRLHTNNSPSINLCNLICVDM